METLKNIRLENIGSNENEFRIIFYFENKKESICFYKGEDIKIIFLTIMRFVKKLAEDYL
jgi:hypothetical protein